MSASETESSSASVVVFHNRVVANFEQWWINLSLIMASTRSRWRVRLEPIKTGKPNLRMVPRMASTWP